MTIKELTQSILKRLEEGTAEIYARYRELAASSDASYEKKNAELDAEYRRAANAASAQAKIDLNNTLEKMADSGYIRSGETVQATIAANSDRQSTLGRLGAERLKGKNELQLSQAKEEGKQKNSLSQDLAALENEADRQILELEREERERLEREQERLEEERAAEAERQAAKEQQEFENRLAVERLNLEKMKVTSSAKADEKEKEEEFKPSQSAYSYVDQVIKNYTVTRVQNGKKQTYVDKNAVIRALGSLVKDENISRSYRYEMYLYAKSLGYTAD